ncbi:hypothetical protein BDM02DRAFT_3106814 [Thelephora ganbajun]|uniref:Uncharacterized protein n=1 Tax=Thelephora ganbajun TaxID=370292 RepID=A0ACB6ZYF4_THEGA|nr:hypothetical protein BDM02DRAFT_3106814 [Thelephora ganbajun]
MEFGEISRVYASPLHGPDPILAAYASFRQATHLSYRAEYGIEIQAIADMIPKWEQHVLYELPTNVLRTLDDPQSILELGTREWTGYGSPQIKDLALARWIPLTFNGSNVSRRIRAQAHSCLALGWYNKATEDPECLNVDAFYRAGSNANEAVSLGLISRTALMVGYQIERIGFRRPETNRFPEWSTDRFEKLNELWEAIDKRSAEVHKERSKQDAKVSKAPHQYVCAANDCGIQATKKSGLLRCAGKCPVLFKPSYCSKECQKVDWKRHKPFCKADATMSSAHSLSTDDQTAEDTERRASLPEDTSPDALRGRSPEYSVDMPLGEGRTLRLSSKTLGPQMMRELRKAAEEREAHN